MPYQMASPDPVERGCDRSSDLLVQGCVVIDFRRYVATDCSTGKGIGNCLDERANGVGAMHAGIGYPRIQHVDADRQRPILDSHHELKDQSESDTKCRVGITAPYGGRCRMELDVIAGDDQFVIVTYDTRRIPGDGHFADDGDGFSPRLLSIGLHA
jgi:hypothetical protein